MLGRYICVPPCPTLYGLITAQRGLRLGLALGPASARAGPVCKSVFLKIFAHFPLSTKYTYFPTSRLCWCNNAIVRIGQCFSVYNGPNHFGVGARAKNFRRLEPDPEPEISSSGSTDLLYAIVAYDTQNAFAKRNLFFVL